MIRPYFRPQPGDPPPLLARVTRVVRFEEVDPMGIVWHGRYAGYFEDARVALGDRLGLGYMDYYANGVMTPIKKLHLDYHLPLRFKESFTVEAALHWSEAARINMAFTIYNSDEKVATTGCTVQLMLDREGTVLLLPPPFHREFLERWRAGALT